MRTLNKLQPIKLQNEPSGKYGDGGGLWLHKRDKDHGKWVLLFRIYGKRREMGLGAYPDVSLKEARESAHYWRSVVREGKDPIKERQRQRRKAERSMHLLVDVAKDAFESRKAELKGDGKAGRWFSPLALHILPRLGNMPVADIDQIDIRDTFSPIWHEKAETARKAISRLKICLEHAAALGLDVDLQAVAKAKALLGAQRHKVEHIPALHWSEVPAFYQSLDDRTVSHLALRLLILTGVRSGSVRHIRLDQIDGDVWTIPEENVKGRVGKVEAFAVPLSDEALRVIELAKPNEKDGFLFANMRKGVISDATMSRMMERRGMEARPHGFRSSLRDWMAEKAKTPYEVAETVLSHKVGGKVERSYRRTDYLEERRPVMQRWADYIVGKPWQ